MAATRSSRACGNACCARRAQVFLNQGKNDRCIAGGRCHGPAAPRQPAAGGGDRVQRRRLRAAGAAAARKGHLGDLLCAAPPSRPRETCPAATTSWCTWTRPRRPRTAGGGCACAQAASGASAGRPPRRPQPPPPAPADPVRRCWIRSEGFATGRSVELNDVVKKLRAAKLLGAQRQRPQLPKKNAELRGAGAGLAAEQGPPDEGTRPDGAPLGRSPGSRPGATPGEAIAQSVAAGPRVHEALNAAGTVAGALRRAGAACRRTAYEQFIFATGRCPVRPGLHDFFNGLVWLRFPRTKRR